MKMFGDQEDEDEGSMFGLKSGSWWISSKSNPKWNKSGSCRCGGFAMPEPAKEAIEELTKQLGPPPEDLEWGYMKN